ncbi:MAG TPA: cytidylate kinase-like family protein [Candidatus Aquilonibacter sp.]|nr:cytidylate kinase-like family protein [Candidatus Aquilonibacter sp.]
MFRLISIEREYGCGGGAIAAQLASRLGWSVWDERLTEEIARLANVDCSAVKRCDERMNSRLYRLAKTFWRGSHERSSHVAGQVFDTDTMMSMMEQITAKIAKEGNAVVVGRGAPFFLRDHPDTFHVFLYAPRAEKIRRLVEDGSTAKEAEEMVDIVDRERIAYVKHYFNSDWPTRSLYHVMVNTAVGNKSVIEIILHTMQLVAGRPKATDYEAPKVPAV